MIKMNKIVVVALALSLLNCKQEPKNDVVVVTDYKTENLEVTSSVYPEDITNIFKAHGTLEAWNTNKTLAFTMKKKKGDELTITDLKNRRSYIETKDFELGYNGKDVWLNEKGDFKYKGKPQFYYNLMFYFYAMPFVLADDGITYDNVDALEFEGKAYPGIKISYGANVGESPEDEYILYYDAETNKMAWLGYTVTYFTKAKSKDWHFIRYTDWQDIDGLLVPKTLSWFNTEGFKIGDKRNDLEFTDIKLSKESEADAKFEKPAI
jgi:hypothetical protein